MKRNRMEWMLAAMAALASASVAWGSGTAEWEREMATLRRPELPGAKTIAEWKAAQAAAGTTEEAGRAARTGLARGVLAACGVEWPVSVEWRTAFASDVERVDVAEFRDALGRRHRFAVYEQPGVQCPYYWIAEEGDAAAVRASAKDIREIEGVLERAGAEVSELGVEVVPPYERFHFLFLDDAPGRDWIRPCRYLFEEADGQGFTVLWKKLPPQVKRRSIGAVIPWAGMEDSGTHADGAGSGDDALSGPPAD